MERLPRKGGATMKIRLLLTATALASVAVVPASGFEAVPTNHVTCQVSHLADVPPKTDPPPSTDPTDPH
jgi:hypothetical protein